MIFDKRSASNIMDPEFPVDSYSRPEQRIGYAGAGTGQPTNSLIGEGEATMSNLSMISRDWRRGMIEFASIGYDYSTSSWRPAARWIVITGRTASGKAMERTDEPMIVTSERHFGSEHEASAWQAQWIAGGGLMTAPGAREIVAAALDGGVADSTYRKLARSWVKAKTEYDRTLSYRDSVAEDEAWDALVDHVDEAGLDGTQLDPRGPQRRLLD